MGTLEIKDNAIWIRHIRGDNALAERLERLEQNQAVMLEVAGIAGEWAKMRDGKDGRRTPGVRPVGRMAEVWKKLQARRGETVEIRPLTSPEEYLGIVAQTLDEWSSPEDSEAYGDL